MAEHVARDPSPHAATPSAAQLSVEEQQIIAEIQELQRHLRELKADQDEQEVPEVKEKARPRRVLIVANRLPIRCSRDARTGRWSFDDAPGVGDGVEGISMEVQFVWVGWVGCDVPPQERARVAERLMREHGCFPVFLEPQLVENYYNGFCNDVLWPLFHYVPLPMYQAGAEKKFDAHLWDAYTEANRRFAEAVMEVYKGDGADSKADASKKKKKLSNGIASFFGAGSASQGADVVWRTGELGDTFEGRKIIIGVDRLDYIKGMPHKLLAFELFLSRNPSWVGKVTLIQVGVPTRVDVAEYQTLAKHVNELVGRINGDELIAIYHLADACLVTSVRDGMNLVSHEYVAAQEDVSDDEAEGEGAKQGALGEEGEGPRRRRESACCKPFAKDGPGALVLSEFAGSAQSLSGAIRVNPWNTEELSRAIHEALTLTRVERELRWAKLHRYVTTNTASYWARSFVSEFRDVCEHPPLLSKLPKLNAASVLSAYSRAKNRLVVTDYDGTLTQIQSLPQLATPAPVVTQLLATLARDTRNTAKDMQIHMEDVMSNLPLEIIQGNRLVEVRHVGVNKSLVLEEVLRMGPRGETVRERPAEASAVATTPGAPAATSGSAATSPDSGTDSPGASDAAASSKADVDFDFVLCVGDDRSDEDMYQLLKAWHARRAEHDADKGGDDAPAQLDLVHIGTGATQAEYYLESVIELRKLLRGMASISLRDLRGAPRAF
ncbi:hypothetical protein JL722_2027 [Aureococcus anophagefferens]|nr:hypothetical protein JL722_2027 [Aureococcus anophagefferens]